MDQLLKYKRSIDGYVFVEKVWWKLKEESAGDVFGEGEYRSGDRYGHVLAINGDSTPDANGYYPCVMLEIVSDWRNFNSDVALVPNDVVVEREIPIDEFDGIDVKIIFNPDRREFGIKGTLLSDAVCATIRRFFADRELILDESWLSQH